MAFSQALQTGIKVFLAFVLSLLLRSSLYAQAPANDDCSNAAVITIPNGGYALGTFISDTVAITNATVEAGETFYPTIITAGENAKSVWYKFTLPVARKCSVIVQQVDTGLVGVGFTVYKSNTCFPTNVQADSSELTPQPVFGSSTNPCVKPGTYLIQVSSKSTSIGSLFVTIVLGDPSPAPYDSAAEAYSFGVLNGCEPSVTLNLGCLTLDSTNEACTAFGASDLNYTQSAWVTFTTPASLDWVGVALQDLTFNAGAAISTEIFGYNLYQGNVKTTPLNNLTLVEGCITDTFTSNALLIARQYECQLLPNTTYTIQLFFNEQFTDNVQLDVLYLGGGTTSSTEPLTGSVAASNLLGILPAGTTTASDHWDCNALLAQNVCGATNPAGGVTESGITYDLNDWYTFTLSWTSNVTFSIGDNGTCSKGGNALFVRIFNGDINGSCNNLSLADIYSEFLSGNLLKCMPPGKYCMQVLGGDEFEPALTGAWRNNLGQGLGVSINVLPVNPYSHFALDSSGAVDSVNRVGGAFSPLLLGVTYNTAVDTFGCNNTVVPAGGHCTCPEYFPTCEDEPAANPTKVIYHEFVSADSGVVTLYGNFSWDPYYTGSMLYSGDANALATAQNVFAYPDNITGLSPSSCTFGYPRCCGYDTARACVTPGTYTLITLGDSSMIGDNASYTLHVDVRNTMYSSPALAENLGDIFDTDAVYGFGETISNSDYFSCVDNTVTLGGAAPCGTSTKLIYRQFYLSAPALIQIASYVQSCVCFTCNSQGPSTLFYGKATDGAGGLSPVGVNYGNNWSCFVVDSTDPCTPMPAGWYTLVSYGEGPTYADPATNYCGDNGYGGDIGLSNYITIVAQKAPLPPKYDWPYKAAVDSNNHQPFVIQPGHNRGTTAYPATDTTYTLYTEHYNCIQDTPFSAHPVVPCDDPFYPNRTTYYVFTLPTAAYVHIMLNMARWWQPGMAEVFPFDVRYDSTEMLSVAPVQPCLQDGDFIEICRLQAGTYTLVIFPDDSAQGDSCTPTIYIDSIGYSRFDNASNAYNFGTINPDGNWYSGKPGDTDPLDPNRAASDDFMYCTTGSQTTDPAAPVCDVAYDPYIYSRVNNIYMYDDNYPGSDYNYPRRNLWYSFVLDKGGFCYIRVNNMTADKQTQYAYAIYQSPVLTGAEDSSLAQGLTEVLNNAVGQCANFNEDSFYVPPCSSPQLYYLVVDNPPGMEPNSQVEMEIKYDTVSPNAPLYDHYYEANVINGLNQVAPPYTSQPLDTGVYYGGKDFYTCATMDTPDPNPCGCKERDLWYKFTVNTSEEIRYSYNINGTQQNFDSCQMILLNPTIPGDSSSTGLMDMNTGATTDTVNGMIWGQTCLTAGTYYILMTGCGRTDESEQPIVWIINAIGDHCDDPVAGTLAGAGSVSLTAAVDCHTMGGDFGEDGSNMACLIPPGDSLDQFKTTWFRVDIPPNDTFDITPTLTNGTNANCDLVRYRMLYGTCNAMTPGSCFDNCQTVNTFYCVTGGTYYFQVCEPVKATGDIELTVTAVKSKPGCTVAQTCLAQAQFSVPPLSCSTDSVCFDNLSTEGDTIIYHWDFGNGDTSNLFSPCEYFQAPNPVDTYKVKLVVLNPLCNAKDSFTMNVIVQPTVHLNLGGDTTTCADSLVLHATSSPGTSYLWQDGSKDSTYTVTTSGTYSVTDSLYGCVLRDTVIITLFPPPCLQANGLPVSCNGGDNGEIIALAGCGKSPYQYSVNGGATQTSGTFAGLTAGTYALEVQDADGCQVDTSITLQQPPPAFTLQMFPTPVICPETSTGSDSVVVTGSTSPYIYSWSNGSTTTGADSLPAGTVYVTVTDSKNCLEKDSSVITSPDTMHINYLIDSITCNGAANGSITIFVTKGRPFYTYQWSGSANTTSILSGLAPGTYTVTVTDQGGCYVEDSFTVIQPAVLQVNTSSTPITCVGMTNGTASVAPSGGISPYTVQWSGGQTQTTIDSLTAGSYTVTVTDAHQCTQPAMVTIAQAIPIVDSPTVVDPRCAGQNTGSITVSISGGNPPYHFAWSNNAPDTNIAANLFAGNYAVTITDANGCAVILKQTLTDPADSITVTITADSANIHYGQSIQLTATPSANIVGIPGYVWTPDSLLSCQKCPNPIAGPLTNTITYAVILTDSSGCPATASITITVDSIDRVLAIPNAFSPNNDGINDVFYVYGYGYKQFSMQIFDRWGELVFQSDDQTKGWDGTYKGEPALPGVYVYYVQVIYLDGQQATRKGSVTLIR